MRFGREGIIEAAEGTRVENVAALALDMALHRFFRHGGLRVDYPDGRTGEYGDTSPELIIRVNTNRPILRLAVDPILAIGEGYTFGEIDFQDPVDENLPPPIDLLGKFVADNGMFNLDRRFGHWFDRQRPATQPNQRDLHEAQIQQHYDIGNAFYDLWLDSTKTYSCAYWDEDPAHMSLETAQQRKIEHILRKLRLEPGQKLLDIGCGWGHLLVTAAQQYDIEGLGITLSKEQLAGCRKLAEEHGVADKVRFDLIDYEDLAQQPEFHDRFDRIVSVGMFEHVGRGRQGFYFAALDKLLKPKGVTLLHTITQQRPGKPVNPWTKKYIFPGGHLPSLSEIANTAAGYGFRDPDVESLREHYALTLDEWWKRFEEAVPTIQSLFDNGRIDHPLVETADQFVRLWRFYLAMSSGGFRYGQLDLLQCVFTKGIDPQKPLTRGHVYSIEAT